MKIPLRKALWLAVGPANVDAAGHAVADWFDGRNYLGAADLIREQLQDQSGGDAVPHDRPDTSLRAELLQKLATHREVLLNLCNRVDRLEMRADGLSPIERVQHRWAKEAAGGDKLDRLIAQDQAPDGPAVSEDREPAAVIEEPSDEELLELMPETMRDEFAYAATACSDATGGQVKPGIFRVCLNTAALEYARAVLARWGHQPAPPAEGEVGDLVAWLRENADYERQMCGSSGQASLNLDRAAELLQQRHPDPVPVRERLPGPEDCTTNPRNGRGQWCWGWVQHDQPPYSGRWRMMLREWLSDEAVAWLPATALPLPAFWDDDCDKTSTSDEQ